jgi:ketosteroid isomerase-like protein
MSNTDRFRAYIAAYARKDLVAIDALLAPDVSLRDWNLSVQGKVATLAETAKNFAAAATIDIDILALYSSEDSVAGELKIVVDGRDELHVVDVITFSAQGAIVSIRAYLGKAEVARAPQAAIEAERAH